MPSQRMADLVAATARGERPDFLFFWGHRPPPGGGLGRGCLSQWWPCSFEVDGQRYPSAEHFMMVGKARLFGDEATARLILAGPDPGRAKALGRRVAGFDQARWRAERSAIVVRGNLAKFSQDGALGDWLVATGGKVLSRPARWTGSGGSGWPPTTSGPGARPSGAGSTCSVSP